MQHPRGSPPEYDAVVVGAGPNGLAAAIALARAGLSTLVIEAHEVAGGGVRSAELTLPGCVHDVCSAVHPLAVASPFFRSLQLERHGLSWVESPAALVHVLRGGATVTLERSLTATAEQLGRDRDAYRHLLEPFVEHFDELLQMALRPLGIPRAPLLAARFGFSALRSLEGLVRSRFREQATGGLLAGLAAHAMLPLDALATTSFALILGAAGHAVGWPVARGGSQAITDALVACLRAEGGELLLGHRIDRLSDLPPARAYVLDVAPRELLRLAADALPPRYVRRLQRFRYGPGVCKVDWALSGPVPWTDPACARAATVHLSGDLRDIAESEAAVHAGRAAERPFVLVVQPSLFDRTRTPPGIHALWAYCHVPNGSTLDESTTIEAQIERHAPGFRELLLARSVRTTADIEHYNPNYVGGDINGGSADIRQLFFRPAPRLDPYSTPVPDLFLCSSSTPPGGGVHGMCGYWAARSVLGRLRSPARARAA